METLSFFLSSSDPPVDSKNIPSGEWLCRQCRGEPMKEGVPLLFQPLVESAIGANPRIFCIPYEMQRRDILPGIWKPYSYRLHPSSRDDA